VEVRSLHHVAMAVEDLDDAVAGYERFFGAEIERRGTMDDQGVEAVYLRLGSGRVELVASLGDDTSVERFLAKRGPGMHHVAFEVDDVEGAIGEIERAGGTVIEPAPRPGLGGHDVAFVHPDSLYGVLAEVVGPNS
jgi:methylmalonyl-CoA epimerase